MLVLHRIIHAQLNLLELENGISDDFTFETSLKNKNQLVRSTTCSLNIGVS